MKMFMMAGLAAMMVTGSAQAQVLVGGWDFTTTATGGTAMTVVPSVLNANFGQGSIYLNGTNGSSAWVSGSSGGVTGAGGTPVNALSGWGTSTAGTSAMAVNNSAGNGMSISFAFSMAGYEDLTLSYAVRRFSTSSFATYFWEYSSDGTSWSTLQTMAAPSTTTAFEIQTLDTTGVLDGDGTAFLRVTLNGASTTSASSIARFDNFQLNATAVPEPSSYMLMGLGLGTLVWFGHFRRRKS